MRERQLPSLSHSFPAHIKKSVVKEDTLIKIGNLALIASLLLVGSSMATLLAGQVKPTQTRSVKVGRATVQVPIHMPKEIIRGNAAQGSVILGSKDDCDITYDQYMAIHWSNRNVPSKKLLPTEAYEMVSETPGPALDLGKDRQAKVRDIRLSAEKPCGRIVKENLKVVELYCNQAKTHIVVAGILNPVMTREKVIEIAQSLQCP
jgi:hypothetical protein